MLELAWASLLFLANAPMRIALADSDPFLEALRSSAAASLDDECQEGSGGEAGCAISALQRRGLKTSAAVSERDQEVRDASHLNSTWGSISDNIGLRRRRSVAVSEESKEASKSCSHVTAGTCRVLACSSTRGSTNCVSGQCLCQEGFCANTYGVCVDPLASTCDREDAITSCRFVGCPAKHGPTECRNNQCYCQEGYCLNRFNGQCVRPGTCSKDTGGSCRFTRCSEDRGPAKCVNGKCICPTGFCAKDSGSGYGVCELQDSPDYLAKIAAVNQEHPEFPSAHARVERGLSFSGGGARALSNALGAYRALEDLGVMPFVDAISSVSGGSWASSIYMFADMPKDVLLGNATDPAELTLEKLGDTPPALGNVVTASCHPFLQRWLTNKLPLENMWQFFIGETILSPFGLDNKKAFMAGSKEQVERIKRENPQLQNATFITPRPDRPKVFVMNGALLSPLGFNSGPGHAVSLQMSPDYTGSPFWPNNGPLSFQPAKNGALYPLSGEIVGGGMVETFAFGSGAPRGSQSQSGREHVQPPQEPFTLALAVGISSVAPGAVLANKGAYNFVVPQSRVWPVTPVKEGKKQEAKEYALGDGGNLENSGLLPLLQRGARKAVMWVSTYIPLSSKRYPDVDFCKPPPTSWDALLGDNDDLVVAPMVSDKFGFKYKDKGSFYTENQVFAKEELGAVLCKMQELKKAGKPVVYRSQHKVLPNSWWGIKGGYSLDLAIVYLEQSKEFESKLPESTRTALGPNNTSERTWKVSGEFARFPGYKTTGQTEESTEITRLTVREVNLLAAQSEYAVRQNEQLFRDMLCPGGLTPAAVCCRDPGSVPCQAVKHLTAE